MNTLPAHLLILILIFLILLTAFFSSTETGIMSINRYRLRHLARKKNPAAIRISELLSKPDKLLGIILIGNTFATIFASAVATILAVRFWGDFGVAATTLILTLVILIFAEITPKVLASLYPEKIAFFASFPLKILLKTLYPLVWATSGIANGLLQIFHLERKAHHKIDTLSHEELRTVVFEALGKSANRYQEMLLGILDLGKATVEDIMIPRNEICGLNLDEQWSKILTQLQSCQHTRLPIYDGDIDNVKGILHVRNVLQLFAENKLKKEDLLKAADQVYFIPEATPLNDQLVNFQQQKVRIGLVVDEYGDIQGLVTLEDILGEIIGQFTTNLAAPSNEIIPQKDGTFLVEGSINIRELNRTLGWNLPVEGPKTLNGLILEYLQTIPSTTICLKISGYRFEILEIEGNFIESVRLSAPALNI
ncbi:MAG: HlyC/CorC family transporter [Gammaproteobacteria bacterium]|nr:HlyC/CorC family transporter [Gammaproteobacteria bacterium]